MDCIEAGAVAQALIGAKSDDGSVREVDAERVDFLDADAKADGNDPVHLQQSHDIVNRAAWHVPVVADLSCRLLDVDRLKRLFVVNGEARQV
ncbi:hypothetical protein [Pseudonocardia sp. NPDC049154]|uniref:hypothetical protein n=1 Tax=Pseudonocardia sp. NPDC049154 TaxID=3155501 RepID=UPI0033E2116A